MTKSISRLFSAVAIAGGLCFAGPAFAAPCDGTNASGLPPSCEEVDPAGLNNTIVGANLLGTLSTMLSVHGTILEDDIDIFRFVLLVTSEVRLTTLDPGEISFDGILTLLDATGAAVSHPDNPDANPNDDGGPDSGSGYSEVLFLSLGPGTYLAKVEGDLNDIIDPDTGEPTGELLHESGDYNLLIERAPIRDGAPVPEPASLVLVGSGLAGLALWRRKRA